MIRKVCVVGLGYIGLPTALIAAQSGFQVTGFDINKNLIAEINTNCLEVSEPGLSAMLSELLHAKSFSAHVKPKISDAYVICVPTPVDLTNDNGKPNLSHVLSAIDAVVPLLKENDLIIIESTCPVGTTDRIDSIIKSKRSDLNRIDVAYCPERILPGNALYEIVNNSRVIGGKDTASAISAKRFYEKFVLGQIRLSNSKTAEMCKLVENSYRDVNIAFANEISMIAAEQGVDIFELIKLANMHPRVAILDPGVGVGGHCLPVDPWFLIDQSEPPAELLRTARKVNKNKTKWVVSKVLAEIDKFKLEAGREPQVAVLGVTYKPDCEDCRESPAAEVCKSLQAHIQDVVITDPYVTNLNGVEIVQFEQAIDACDIFVLLVKHKLFTENLKLLEKSGLLIAV